MRDLRSVSFSALFLALALGSCAHKAPPQNVYAQPTYNTAPAPEENAKPYVTTTEDESNAPAPQAAPTVDKTSATAGVTLQESVIVSTDNRSRREKRKDAKKEASGASARPPAPPAALPSEPLPLVAVSTTTAPDPTGTESYEHYRPNPWVEAAKDKLSTFSIDVDTASYTIARRKLGENTLPPASAVRVEEFVNYFNYNYASPSKEPFAIYTEAAPSPFDSSRVLFKVGLQGKRVSAKERQAVHLTFLVDVSGSMSSADKLGLAKKSLAILVNNLKKGDTVALTTYAGATKLVLPPTGIDEKQKILDALDELTSGGGTGMASGLELAYQQATASYEKGSVNRVIVLSDGDANLGPSSHEEMLRIIGGYVEKGVTLTTVGFGSGNYKDTTMEQLANKGNGNYVYIDSLDASHRFFGEQINGTLQVIAKDTKIQVEFSDDAVAKYRLVGYENRDIADQDFRNDKVDAGEVGAGHTVTAIYELQLTPKPVGALGTVRVRAKQPEGSTAQEWAFPVDVAQQKARFEDASSDFQFSAAVVAFAEVLRQNPEAKSWSLERIQDIAKKNTNDQKDRSEFVTLVGKARTLLAGQDSAAPRKAN